MRTVYLRPASPNGLNRRFWRMAQKLRNWGQPIKPTLMRRKKIFILVLAILTLPLLSSHVLNGKIENITTQLQNVSQPAEHSILIEQNMIASFIASTTLERTSDYEAEQPKFVSGILKIRQLFVKAVCNESKKVNLPARL